MTKVDELKFIRLNSYLDGKVVKQFDLSSTKLLVGNDQNCDIYIDDPYISKYHAFIVLDEDGGGRITDLASTNGIFINGKPTKEGYFCIGDRLEIGNVEFHVEEYMPAEGTRLTDFDQEFINVQVLDKGLFEEKISEPPPAEGLAVIDGEYCDIVFDDNQFSPLTHSPVESDLDFQSYINTSEDENILPITRDKNELCLQVLTLSNGNILTYDYLPLKDKSYFISNKENQKDSILFFGYEDDKDFPFISIDNGKVSVQKIESHESFNKNGEANNPFGSNNSLELKTEDCIVFSKGTNQLIVKFADAPPHLKVNPFFSRDPEFKKQAGKIFSAMMSIMLLLLFVKITEIKEPVEVVSVVYRKAVKKTTFSKDNSPKENQIKKEKKGSRKNNQNNKKVASAQTPKEKASPKASSPEPSKKTVTKAKVKQYEFKMADNLKSLFGKSKSNEKTQLKKAVRALASVKGLSGAKAASTASLKSSSSVNAGSLGADLGGKFDSSSGVKGFAEKKGIDTTYIDPRTVVLGSMDPELLRKILQEYLPQFRHCYQQELQYKDDSAKGVIDMNFRIEKSGRVSKVNISSKGGKFSKKGVGCMAGVLKIIDFPKPKGGGLVDVRQPLNFFSENSKI